MKKYVVINTQASGMYIGTLKSHSGANATLIGAKRIHKGEPVNPEMLASLAADKALSEKSFTDVISVIETGLNADQMMKPPNPDDFIEE